MNEEKFSEIERILNSVPFESLGPLKIHEGSDALIDFNNIIYSANKQDALIRIEYHKDTNSYHFSLYAKGNKN